EKAMNLDNPALLIHGGNDRITSWKATSMFADKAPEGQFHLFDECYHEIHNEPECNDALGIIAKWIESKITRPIPRKNIDRA
ncbi:MAG: alpha/beta hydrolase, partial [bacterium]